MSKPKTRIVPPKTALWNACRGVSSGATLYALNTTNGTRRALTSAMSHAQAIEHFTRYLPDVTAGKVVAIGSSVTAIDGSVDCRTPTNPSGALYGVELYVAPVRSAKRRRSATEELGHALSPRSNRRHK